MQVLLATDAGEHRHGGAKESIPLATDDGERGHREDASFQPQAPVNVDTVARRRAILLATDDGERGHGEDAFLLGHWCR